jgi:hypothetical protein
MMTIKDQIFSALNAAHLENEYPHNFENNPQDIVAEILECSGSFEGFDEENLEDMKEARAAVICWRDENYDKLKEVN